MKESKWLKEILVCVLLLAIMFFFVKGVPALMGGAHDASGNPAVITWSQTAPEAPQVI